jgi:uncharacterized membrane protein YkoI
MYMKTLRISLLIVAAVAISAMAAQTSKKQTGKAKVELPPAVAKTVADNRPSAEIAKVEVEKENGVTVYDIEFKAGQGEMDVAEDGSLMNIETVVQEKDVPKPALDAIMKAAASGKVNQIGKSEIHAEAKDGKIMKLDAFKYVYEADLEKGNQRAEVGVAPDGKVIEAPKWKAKSSKKE